MKNYLTASPQRPAETAQAPSLILPAIINKTYTQGVQIDPWLLPEATTKGESHGQLTYYLYGIPPGLSANSRQTDSRWRIPGDSPDAFRMSGTPNEAGTYHLRYSVRNVGGRMAMVSFTITVRYSASPLPVPRGKLYWTTGNAAVATGGKIFRSNLYGTEVETMYHRPSIPADDGGYYGGGYPTGIAISDDKMYWLDTGTSTMQRANLDGTGVERLASIGSDAHAIAVGIGKAYWSDLSGGTIQSMNLDGTEVESVADRISKPLGIAISGGKVYWVDGSTTWHRGFGDTVSRIQRANLDGTDIETLLTEDMPGMTLPAGIAISGDKMYWTNRGRYDEGGIPQRDGGIYRANLDGTNVEALIVGLYWPIAIAVYHGRMYWIEIGAIKSANLGGTDVRLLVSEAQTAFGSGLSIH